MINRNYLPYQSAKTYKDRGMAKWMGFFISEHSTALSHAGDSIRFSDSMAETEKMLLLSQVFLQRQTIQLFTTLKKEPFLGTISDMNAEKLYFKTKTGLPNFSYSQILSLTLAEEIEKDF